MSKEGCGQHGRPSPVPCLRFATALHATPVTLTSGAVAAHHNASVQPCACLMQLQEQSQSQCLLSLEDVACTCLRSPAGICDCLALQNRPDYPSACLQAATEAALGLPPLQRDAGLLRMCHVLAELCKLACEPPPPPATLVTDAHACCFRAQWPHHRLQDLEKRASCCCVAQLLSFHGIPHTLSLTYEP